MLWYGNQWYLNKWNKAEKLTHCAYYVVQIGPIFTPYPLIRLFVCSSNDFISKNGVLFWKQKSLEDLLKCEQSVKHI